MPAAGEARDADLPEVRREGDTMNEWIGGVDVSVYQGDISQAQWDLLYLKGQRVAVVGAAHPRRNPYCRTNLERAKRSGFILATYAVVWPGMTGEFVIDTAKDVCGSFWGELAFVGVDCEVDGIASAVRPAVERVKALKQRPVIYTGRWWWVDHNGNSSALKDVPLWSASYDNDPDIDFQKAPYGGWTLEKLMGEQYAGTVVLEGQTVDRNSFRKQFVEVADMPDIQNQQRIAAATILLDATKTILAGQPLPADLKAKVRFLAS